MDISAFSGRKRRCPGRRDGGFSLVEVTLAVGIVAFGFLAVFGLIPTGLNVMRQAIDATTTSAITQRVMNDAQQTDFSQLLLGAGVEQPIRYFDDQGAEVAATAALYQVRTLITATTSMPGNPNMSTLATITIQVAYNPGRRALTPDRTTNLWKDSSVSIATYSGFVSQAR